MAKTSNITINFDKEENSTLTITATVGSDLIEKNLNDSIKHMGEELTIKGFRKGMAPVHKLKEQLDPQKLINHTLEHLFPDVLKAIFKEKDLKLSGNPTLRAITTPDSAPWTITLDLPLVPEFELGSYEKVVKKALKDVKGDEDRLKILLDTLIAEIKFEVPAILLEQEVNHSLARLYDQTQNLGITVDQYLKSMGKTSEQIRTDYQKAAEDNLKIEFILDRIAQDKKITVAEKEIEALINASGSEDAKRDLENPNQKLYVRSILKKRKTIDALLQV